METVIAVTLGVVMGYGAGKLHPRVNGGMVVNIIAGAIGGLIGAALLGPVFTPVLSDVALAGAALGAAVGGTVLTIAAGFALNRARGR